MSNTFNKVESYRGMNSSSNGMYSFSSLRRNSNVFVYSG